MTENNNFDFDLFIKPNKSAFNDSLVQVFELSTEPLSHYINQNIHLKSSLFILVLEGSTELTINFKKYNIQQDQMAILSFGHFFSIENLSSDFKCIALYIGKNYITEMYPSEMIYKRVRYDVRMFSSPMLDLEPKESSLISDRLQLLKKVIENTKHRYYKEIVLSTLKLYFLDLSDLIEERTEKLNYERLSRDELFFKDFLDDLVLNYKNEHLADFYADKLNITAHYLNTIVKRLSGQTISDFVYQLLFSDAKMMLEQPNLSIQQIAEELNFSDQSAFGKFFKRKSGYSPKTYRNEYGIK